MFVVLLIAREHASTTHTRPCKFARIYTRKRAPRSGCREVDGKWYNRECGSAQGEQRRGDPLPYLCNERPWWCLVSSTASRRGRARALPLSSKRLPHYRRSLSSPLSSSPTYVISRLDSVPLTLCSTLSLKIPPRDSNVQARD